jgi:hypothetical protein
VGRFGFSHRQQAKRAQNKAEACGGDDALVALNGHEALAFPISLGDLLL